MHPAQEIRDLIPLKRLSIVKLQDGAMSNRYLSSWMENIIRRNVDWSGSAKFEPFCACCHSVLPPHI